MDASETVVVTVHDDASEHSVTEPPPDMQTYLESINDEERLTFYFTATHEVAEYTDQLAQQLHAATKAVERAKTALHAEMTAHDLECLRLGPRLFARTVIRQSSGKDLTPDTVQAVISQLTPDAIQAVLTAQRAARQAALQKAAAAVGGTKRKRARKDGDSELSDVDVSAAACATLCDPAVTYAGKNKVPCRATVPITRDLTQPELYAEAMYAQLHALHKPRRKMLCLSETFPKTDKRVLVELPDAPLAIQKAAGMFGMARDAAARAATLDVVQTCTQERAARKEWLVHIKPRVHAYVKACGGKLVRIVPLADGTRRTMVAEIVQRVRRARSLTLWELSQVLDGAVAEWSGATDIDPLTFSNAVAARVAAALDAKILSTEALRTRRGRAEAATTMHGTDTENNEEHAAHTVGGVLLSARLLQELQDLEPMEQEDDAAEYAQELEMEDEMGSVLAELE